MNKSFYSLLGYTLITSTGYCSHVNGGFPTNCSSSSILTQRNCESFCTSQTSCVSYIYSSSETKCMLLPSDFSCPSNFQLNTNTHTATTINDLVATPYLDHVCYGKNSGKFSKS